MQRGFLIPRAVFFKFKLPLNFFLIFARVIRAPLADGADKRNQVFRVFRFSHRYYPTRK